MEMRIRPRDFLPPCVRATAARSLIAAIANSPPLGPYPSDTSVKIGSLTLVSDPRHSTQIQDAALDRYWTVLCRSHHKSLIFLALPRGLEPLFSP
jgi:hypothetical protein